MKTALSALALTAALASTATAGAMSEPIIENDVIVTDTTNSSSASGVGLILLLAAVIFAAAAD